MNESATAQRFEDLLSRVKRPARLIGGEAGASSGFSGASGESRVVLAFPDTYEIGISNQALQILYHLAQQCEGVAVERAYLPWVDVIEEMRKARIPLLTTETWSPVASADLLGITLQHESNFTNLLELLDLAGLPLRAAERDESHPLVVAGGPACSNFLPVAPFLDAVVVGDGERVFPEMLRVLTRCRREAVSRAAKKQALSELEGVFVPGVSREVKRACLEGLQDAAYPAACLVPLTEGVHDRAWVEIMRGCTRGCRFCQAGMWYRPVRERAPGQVLAMTKAQLDATGYQEVALASLSTTDYTCLGGLLAALAQERPECRVSLPSLRVDGAAVQLAALTSPTGPSLTLAPEAGSQRMRDIINKNVSESDILSAAEEAVRMGKTTLKLYFMNGLPEERDEDAVAIADLCLKIRDDCRQAMGTRAGRLQLNVSVNNFIPKPFTPFQWTGMADRATLLHRQGLIRSGLRRPGMRVSFSRVDSSYLEAALARGGESLGDVIEAAWRRGARLDSWSEQFRGEAWDAAFTAAGTSAEHLATAELDPDQALPWDVITGSVDKAFLATERERAKRGETTPDCRWAACSGCGVCEGALQNELAAAGTAAAATPGPGPSPAALEPALTAATPSPGSTEAERYRYCATFSVSGRGRFLGHLDKAEVFRRAVRRAGGRLALSAGMRPKAQLSLALPLAVGVEGLEEMAEFELAEPADSAFAARLADALPRGLIHLEGVERYRGRRSLAARVAGASYLVTARLVGGDESDEALRAALREACTRFAESASVIVQETREGSPRQVDVRAYVDSIAIEQDGPEALSLVFRAQVGPSGTARPELVVRGLAGLAGVELVVERMVRTRIHLAED